MLTRRTVNTKMDESQHIGSQRSSALSHVQEIPHGPVPPPCGDFFYCCCIARAAVSQQVCLGDRIPFRELEEAPRG